MSRRAQSFLAAFAAVALFVAMHAPTPSASFGEDAICAFSTERAATSPPSSPSPLVAIEAPPTAPIGPAALVTEPTWLDRVATPRLATRRAPTARGPPSA